MSEVHLGFEIGTGRPVSIPIRHMVVTGQTQEAGKTTTLEALISRAPDGLNGLAFITKRGEGAFTSAIRLRPYFRERADWRFVSAVLESTMREKMKFERAWIMKACKGATTLRDVHRNVRRLMDETKGLSHDIYVQLDEYLNIVTPRIGATLFANNIMLGNDLNVMDLSNNHSFPQELQGLVIRSALEYVYEEFEDTITIIPEAWEFIPEGRGSPVKLAAEALIRKGAGLRNYVWLDTQDIGGVDKVLLRSCPVWLIGVQREANEIKRTLANIPAGIKKPKAADIATLKRGQFYACFGEEAISVYVQPAEMSDADARHNALHPDSPRAIVRQSAPQQKEDEDMPDPVVHQKLDRIAALLEKLVPLAGALNRAGPPPEKPDRDPEAELGTSKNPVKIDDLVEVVAARVLARIRQDPVLLKLATQVPEIEVEQRITKITADTSTLHGMFAVMISEGFFESPRKAGDAWRETQRRWDYRGPAVRGYEQLDTLVEQGFLTKEKAGKEISYVAVKGMKVNIKKV